MPCTPDTVLQLSRTEITELRLEDFDGRIITQPEFEHIACLLDTFWRHDGDPARPHAIVTSGQHSSGIIDVGEILTYPNLCEIFAYSLACIVRAQVPTLPERPPWVVGSDHADATFSQRVAYFLRAQRADFAEKAGVRGEMQTWPRHKIPRGIQPVHIEELINAQSTAMRLRSGIRERHSYAVDFSLLATLVHRPDMRKYPTGLPIMFEGQPIISAYFYDMPSWDPTTETCPLCAVGSKGIAKPKKHWANLTGR